MIEPDEAPPEADRHPACPHPRAVFDLFGQDDAEATFTAAVGSERLHHAWLIHGPRGIGKATLAWRIARQVLTIDADGRPESGPVGAEHPVARRLLALSEPRLKLIRRPWDVKRKTHPKVIPVDEVRSLSGFLGLSAPDNGWRVVLIDSVDDMAPAAANALLKLLEEPPDRCVMLLVSHQPSRLLPTIRSRCRTLKCAPLQPDDLARALSGAGFEAAQAAPLQALAGGSTGAAVDLLAGGGLTLYQNIVTLLGTLPRLDRAMLNELADRSAARDAQDIHAILCWLLPLFIARLARSGATGSNAVEAAEGETALFRRLCPGTDTARIWAECTTRIDARAQRAQAVNLDPWQVMFDMFLDIESTAGRVSVPA